MALDYEIVVTRGKKDGRLKFSAGAVVIDTTCWWDPDVVIDANPEGYACWRTVMATKTDSKTHKPRPGIWFGKGIKYASGTKTSDAIFIHEGSSTGWSRGCIVCKRDEMLKMYDAIAQSSQPNVLVKVTDDASA